MNHFSQNWNLETLFPQSQTLLELNKILLNLKHEILAFTKQFEHVADIKKGILHFATLEAQTQDLQYFSECLLSQNVNDTDALKMHGECILLKAECNSLGEEINNLLADLDKQTFDSLLNDSDLQPIAFHLKERRDWTKEKLPLEQEKLALRLGTDGYQGWNDVYDTWIGQLKIPSPFPHEKNFSIGQAENQLSSPDRKIRQAWFHRWEETWTTHENLIAQFLNHIAGFRINLYEARKWPSVLHEPLFGNRMKESTLQVMWTTVDNYKLDLVKYLERKAQLLGLKQLAWYDIEATLPGGHQKKIPFDDAAQFIIKHFSEFSSDMGEFAALAFKEKWIEAEDRPRKRPGGFCAPFLLPQQSRIFMTYSGTMTNVFTLAHELGHAYHSYVMKDLPFFAQQYRMNVAETASTLAEMVTINSMIEECQDSNVQLALLDNQLQRSVIFLMNIHARYLFELDFYKERKKGFVLPKDLNALMESAQRKAFANSLSEWHPHFWAAKQHFYFTEVPFYNFPYTFGYLFSLGIYTHLQKNGNAAEAYASLLRDSGRLTVEELACRHLNINLEEPIFWESALNTIKRNIDRYLELSKVYRT